MRLFIGVKTGCEDYLSSLQEQLKNKGKGNFMKSANLHMTLKFLGEAPHAKVKDICGAMAQAQPGAMRLICEELQMFGRDILSVKVGGEQDKLSALYQSLETALEAQGFEKDTRRFSPHITLVRHFRPFGEFDITSIPTKHIEFNMSDVVLFESTRVAGSLAYKPLFRLER